ncbi:MAG TPA: ATP-binding protein [Polyangiaceae bacterium]|jgi:signal transduction histidine kinase
MIPSSAPPAALLDAADPSDELAVAFAVRRCAERLRASAWEIEELAPVVGRLRALAKDPSARVRQSVAEASPYLPGPVFQELHALLAGDLSAFVRDAAKRATKRHAAVRREAASSAEHDARVEEWYRAIEKKGARALARRIASHETEYFVRRIWHEAGPAFGPLSATLALAKDAIDAPALDRDALRTQLARLEERVGFLKHVLETARTHAQAIVPEFRSEKLGEVVLDEAALLPTRFPERAARLEVDVSGVDRALACEVDVSFVRQAIGNVLKNAVEAYDRTPDARIRLRLTAGRAAGGIEASIAITDEGCGMSPEQVDRAFVPFGSDKAGGTGFGLFIARRVARLVHGGDLTIASRPGDGTTVTIALPLRQEAPKKRAVARRRVSA